MSEGSEGPLSGLLVVSVEQAVAAPFATCRLADAGRARHQGRAAGGRLRAALRPPRGRRVRLVRLAQPGQGIGRPRHQGPGRQLPAAAHDRARGRLRAEPRARCCGTGGPRFRRAQSAASPPRHLRHQRLRRERAVRADEGLRLPYPVRIGDRVGDGDAGVREPRRRLGLRHRRRAQRLRRDPRSGAGPRADRAGARASGSRSSTAWRTG